MSPMTSQPTTITNTNYMYLTSVTSLLLDTPTHTSTLQLTNPDQAATTLTIASAAPTSSPSTPPLPSGLPSVILPQPQLNLSLVPTDYTLINVLFNQSLNWEWVATNADSPGQIFEYFPEVIATALGIGGRHLALVEILVLTPVIASQVMNYDLIVYEPSTYTSDKVDTLSSLIANQKSVFYTGQSGGIPTTLAACVDPSLALDAIAGPTPGGSSSSSSGGSDVRKDAIIGVVSSLGTIAFMIVGYVAYRSYKRRQEAGHRPLTEVVGVRPEGQEFDRDSVGGPRRRSFYYAEDSLRGYQGVHPEDETYDHRASVMRDRRPIIPAAISTPILRESTMNW
ncbi:hypothetical protein F5J12DRAFT_803148 [Pisolithus orientalis]|uniref:uncharacterized protein n=1 Tax=Pisolithus orientalis TaxID=936130 RepID=UPI0022248F3D|nr:uncharacterized protein F5J12DRAFT_803148 [Pisolithus orientalis]KAI6030815.1 hypothetical protein F5J12DRAFT_803148 [Pisolithus orientalis]